MHRWDLTYTEAIEIQISLKDKVVIRELKTIPQQIAGVDLAFDKKTDTGFCSIVVLLYPELKVIETVRFNEKVHFPYIPGLLSFREGPLVLSTFRKLNSKPDLLIFDGQGIAHPRKLGIASHIGLFLGLPTIGCAKSRLCGNYDEPDKTKGSTSILTDNSGEQIGTVLRTRQSIKPVIVSPGHMTGFQDSVKFALECTTKYRIPEPTRLAHIDVSKYKAENISTEC